MSINPNKFLALEEKMSRLGLFEKDLVEKFVRGSGKGGQKINKTSNCVWIKHIPTGLEVKCQQSRSREENRFFARRLVCEKYELQILKLKTEKQKVFEKIRRQKRKRSKRAKEKMLHNKKFRSEKKELRKKPAFED